MVVRYTRSVKFEDSLKMYERATRNRLTSISLVVNRVKKVRIRKKSLI